MSTDDTRLRGGRPRLRGPWPLGSFPRDVITGICKQLVYRMAIGHSDIAGDDFGDIFAKVIGGHHKKSPIGIVDVVRNGNAWSVKTVKCERPFEQKIARLISGRNSPDFSRGIQNPHEDLNATGKAVLDVWNARVNESLSEYDDLRIAVFLRNMSTREFVLFEETAQRYAAGDYVWTKNRGGNLEGRDKATDEHKFTWQFHGSQFTVKRNVPGSAIKFGIKYAPPMLLELEQVLKSAHYSDEWIVIAE